MPPCPVPRRGEAAPVVRAGQEPPEDEEWPRPANEGPGSFWPRSRKLPLWRRATAAASERPRPDPGRAARVFQPDESIEHAQAIILGDARTDQGLPDWRIRRVPAAPAVPRVATVPLGARAGARSRPTPPPPAPLVFQRIIDEIGDGLTGKLPACMHGEAPAGWKLRAPMPRSSATGCGQSSPTYPARDGRGVEIDHAFAPGAGFRAGDARRRIEDLESSPPARIGGALFSSAPRR